MPRGRALSLPPNTTTQDDLRRDAAAAAGYFKQGEALLGRLVPPAQRSDAEKAAAAALHAALRSTRLAFLRTYTDELYAQITADYSRFVQPEALVDEFAGRCPGLAPTRAAIDTDHARALKHKEQIERDQALVLWQVLAQPRAGAHLTHAMLQPRPESLERLEDFRRTGVADFGVISLKRDGRAGT
jgi:(3,5-dihydroxyphenyl)acetyl-CoA 1,2-dioxygenase